MMFQSLSLTDAQQEQLRMALQAAQERRQAQAPSQADSGDLFTQLKVGALDTDALYAAATRRAEQMIADRRAELDAFLEIYETLSEQQREALATLVRAQSEQMSNRGRPPQPPSTAGAR